MRNAYEVVLNNTKKIESLLEEKCSAEGRGLHGKIDSVEGIVDSKIVKKIHYIATIRNNLLHVDGFEIGDTSHFESESKKVIQYLSATDFNEPFSSKGTNSTLLKTFKVFGTPIMLFIASGLFFFTLFSQHNPQAMEDSLAQVMLTILIQSYFISCLYWGYKEAANFNPLLKIILFPFILIAGIVLSPVRIYQGIKIIRAQ